jgi:heptosyltransferase II
VRMGPGLKKDGFESQESPLQRVLLIQTAFVGDVVFASPLVRAIKERYPDVHLGMLVRPSNIEVAQCIPGVDEVFTDDEWGQEKGFGGILKTAERIREKGYDWLVSPQRSARTAMVSYFSRVPLRLGYKSGLGRLAYTIAVRNNPKEPCNLLQDLKLLTKMGIDAGNTRLSLKGPREKKAVVDEFRRQHAISENEKCVAFCIGSVWPTKRWPPVYFASLAEALKKMGIRPILFGSKSESPIANEIEELAGNPMVQCLGTSLGESATLLETCMMAVGGDSGLTHMARALGVPVIVIYGPTDHRTHAYGDGTKVLFAKVKCRPCTSSGQIRCPQAHHDCMRLVSPEQVLDALRSALMQKTDA